MEGTPLEEGLTLHAWSVDVAMHDESVQSRTLIIGGGENLGNLLFFLATYNTRGVWTKST